MHKWLSPIVAHQHTVVGRIFALVSVDKCQIELLAERRCNFERRADV